MRAEATSVRFRLRSAHDDRLKEVADRVLWLEDGAFRNPQNMETDPVCDISVDPQVAPHLQIGEEII